LQCFSLSLTLGRPAKKQVMLLGAGRANRKAWLNTASYLLCKIL